MEFVLPPAWRALLREETEKPYWSALSKRVDEAYDAGEVFPPRSKLFSAFELTPPERVRVVILGQDPYHEPGQANGLAFSVRPGIKLPPSLQNIYKELEADLSVPAAKNGDLTSWARQGVFLLNTVLSVQAHRANAHKDFGWQTFTDAVIAVALGEDVLSHLGVPAAGLVAEVDTGLEKLLHRYDCHCLFPPKNLVFTLRTAGFLFSNLLCVLPQKRHKKTAQCVCIALV